MKENLLSFCILSYNHESYIEECVESIVKNDYKNIEIIALDDGSKDKSVEILNKLKETVSCPMKVVVQENEGRIGANFNKLIKEANGEYVAIIACDDSFILNTINKKVEILKNNKELQYVFDSKIRTVDETGKPYKKQLKMPLNNKFHPKAKDILDLEYKKTHSYFIQGAIYRKSFLDEINGFDDDLICDDIVLRTKAAKTGAKFKMFKKEGVNYRRHSNSASTNSLRMLKGIFEYLERYHSEKQPPAVFLNSICSYLIQEPDSKNELLEVFKEGKNFKIYEGVLNGKLAYKTTGIPYIFEIERYFRENKKQKRIKIFNIGV